MNKYRQSNISARQLTALTVFFTIGSGILIVPSSVTTIARQDAWIACLVGLAIGILMLCMFNLLTKLYPQLNLVQMMEAVFGKWLGKLIALLVVVSLFITGPSPALYFTSNFITTQIMPETPTQAINILFVVVIIMGARLGLETIARSSELMFFPFIILFISFVILILNQTQTENILPVMENGMRPIWSASLDFMVTVLLPHITLLIFHSSAVNKPKEARRALLIGSAMGGMAITLIVALAILVFGPDIIISSMYPSYLLAQKINIGNFLQRIEVIMAIMWYTTLFIRIAIYIFFTAISLTYIFNLRNYRPLVMPLGMILVSLSEIVYPNASFHQTWDSSTWISYTLVLSVFLPVVMLLTHMIRNMATNGANPASNASNASNGPNSSNSSNSQNSSSSSDSSSSSGSSDSSSSSNSSMASSSSNSASKSDTSGSSGSSGSSSSSNSADSSDSSSSSDSSD
ncbi:GerAB/ArcD/ProY family transporter [Paenibacillus lutimineralis]|uniref:GerAB/ArcD/ProY family transporter n=1 Tax=Paenibacillus TaxID=44249 RepID=UPI003EBEB88E